MKGIRGSTEFEKQFIDVFEQLCRRHHSWKVWQDFVNMSACAIANAVDKRPAVWKLREDSYMEHETKELFNAIINEMDRMQERIYNKIDSSIDAFKEENRQQHEQMIHEINACKLNLDTVDLLLKKVIQLENEIDILKEQMRKLTA